MVAHSMGGRTVRSRHPSTARSKHTLAPDPRCKQGALSLFHPSFSTPRLAKLRAAVLDHLLDLETRLCQLEHPLLKLKDEPRAGSSPLLEAPQNQRTRAGTFSASAIDEARAAILHGLEMLSRIRADVSSQLPDFSSLDFLPDFSLEDVRSHIPSFEIPELDLHLSSTPSLEDASLNLEKIQSPLSYLPTLSNHLEGLHEHLLSLQLPASLSFNSPTLSHNGRISELIDKLKHPDLFTDPLKSPLDFLGDSRTPSEFNEAENKAQVQLALSKSRNGERLIFFEDLPHRYRNDEYVTSGYRFIPLFRWHLLLLSIFQWHNETTHIWTHLIPLLYSLASLSSSLAPFISPIQSAEVVPADLADHVFTIFSSLCLLSSCVWHVMAGCAHGKAMETAARIDYVGIGWLISVSIGSVVYYGFSCRPQTALIYISVSFILGVAGSIFPFMSWFNERQHKKWRILFFLSLVFTLVIPVAHLAVLHSFWDLYTFMRVQFTSLAAYCVGLIFYSSHFPECVVSEKWRRYTDLVGGGSHTIWHVSIVLAFKLQKDAMVEFRRGIGEEVCKLDWDGSEPLIALKRLLAG